MTFEADDRPPLLPVRDLSPARWLHDAMPDFAKRIAGSLLPAGYEAYVRILHPLAGGEAGRREADVTWSDVAAWSGRELHPLVQWSALSRPVGHEPGPRPWDGEDPDQGCLPDQQIEALSALLAPHTTTPGDCLFALWAGYGFLHQGAMITLRGKYDGEANEDRTQAASATFRRRRGLAVSDLPQLELPNREYLIFRGHVHDARHVSLGIGPHANDYREGPNLWWPSDRAWVVASEIDLDSTYLACSSELAREVLRSPQLEALLASPEDEFHMDADTVNGTHRHR